MSPQNIGFSVLKAIALVPSKNVNTRDGPWVQSQTSASERLCIPQPSQPQCGNQLNSVSGKSEPLCEQPHCTGHWNRFSSSRAGGCPHKCLCVVTSAAGH